MKLDDVLKLPAGRELDRIVGERIIGCRIRHQRKRDLYDLVIPGGVDQVDFCEPGGPWGAVPHYSTSIEAAWQVVEKLRTIRQHVQVHANNGWGCSAWNVRKVDAVGLVAGTAETAPLAICRAALKATWREQDED